MFSTRNSRRSRRPRAASCPAAGRGDRVVGPRQPPRGEQHRAPPRQVGVEIPVEDADGASRLVQEDFGVHGQAHEHHRQQSEGRPEQAAVRDPREEPRERGALECPAQRQPLVRQLQGNGNRDEGEHGARDERQPPERAPAGGSMRRRPTSRTATSAACASGKAPRTPPNPPACRLPVRRRRRPRWRGPPRDAAHERRRHAGTTRAGRRGTAGRAGRRASAFPARLRGRRGRPSRTTRPPSSARCRDDREPATSADQWRAPEGNEERHVERGDEADRAAPRRPAAKTSATSPRRTARPRRRRRSRMRVPGPSGYAGPARRRRRGRDDRDAHAAADGFRRPRRCRHGSRSYDDLDRAPARPRAAGPAANRGPRADAEVQHEEHGEERPRGHRERRLRGDEQQEEMADERQGCPPSRPRLAGLAADGAKQRCPASAGREKPSTIIADGMSAKGPAGPPRGQDHPRQHAAGYGEGAAGRTRSPQQIAPLRTAGATRDPRAMPRRPVPSRGRKAARGATRRTIAPPSGLSVLAERRAITGTPR